jgi:hypothetical protein
MAKKKKKTSQDVLTHKSTLRNVMAVFNRLRRDPEDDLPCIDAGMIDDAMAVTIWR